VREEKRGKAMGLGGDDKGRDRGKKGREERERIWDREILKEEEMGKSGRETSG